MDRAWFLLMLHSGLRSGEVRRLCLDDLDFQSRTIRINQSKGNKDRIVYFSQMVSDALTAFLEVRCSMRGLPDNVFIFRGKSLSQSYFGQRLRIYATRCDVLITPHQLRHTCATWLLNERVSIASVQKILGHQRVDITMRYARLYDATVAEDYSKAMKRIEGNPPS